jgi:thiamine kinase-like enzyme
MNDSQIPPELITDLQPFTGVLLEVTKISGGITNCNFKLETENGVFMLRLAGERTELLGINRAHEFTCAQTAFQVGVGAEPIVFLEPHMAILTRFVGAAQTLGVSSAQNHLERIVKLLKRYHSAPKFPSSFNPFQTVRNYHALALEHGVKLPTDTPQILEIMQKIETALEPHAQICCPPIC